MLKIIAVSTALALAAGAAVAAPAGYGSTVVRVGDLDLGRPADVERLQRRLESAALEVCGAHAGSVQPAKANSRQSAAAKPPWPQGWRCAWMARTSNWAATVAKRSWPPWSVPASIHPPPAVSVAAPHACASWKAAMSSCCTTMCLTREIWAKEG